LRRTKDLFLVYGADKELVVKGYIDASFVTDPDDSKSKLGYVFTLTEVLLVGRGLIKELYIVESQHK
jgi:hypothetical protein